jgi:hypothetical protein
MIATQNAARTSRGTPEPSPPAEDSAPIGRDEIAKSLASKDPTWFRQTSDRGHGSAAYRKTQVEDTDVAETSNSLGRMKLPGMAQQSRDLLAKDDDDSSSKFDLDQSSSHSRSTSRHGSIGQSSMTGTTSSISGLGSPIPKTAAQFLPPPSSAGSSSADKETFGSGRPLAMSPSQGRISPDRADRPISPTKGMGGFVQSAMMKRSDSVNKRWSVQSPTGLTRGNSVVGNRSSHDFSVSTSPTRETRPSSLSRENTPVSRPTSSHSSSTVVPDAERPGTSSSLKSSMTYGVDEDGFVKPSLPGSTERSFGQDTKLSDAADTQSTRNANTTPPPLSPSKTGDTRRWSPTKSSWLESALNKPESPKPKAAPPAQPSWMAEINKAKQRGSVESLNSPVGHKHEVNIGGLAKPLSLGGFPETKSKPLAFETKSTPPTADKAGNSAFSVTEKVKNSFPVADKAKPDTPPKKDFRANLKPRQLPTDSDGKQEPEFKNVFGNLRRTKTQNYVAPDPLKDNILRGKAGLSMTGGPKKTERNDEFKEAILKKKEDFKKAQLEGTGVTKSTTNIAPAEVPEALRKKAALGRSGTISAREEPSKEAISSPLLSLKSDIVTKSKEAVSKPATSEQPSAPPRSLNSNAPASKLAGRFNPALAGLLAKGAPSSASQTAPQSHPTRANTSDAADSSSGPQLTHMTKARARGPKRKAPSAAATAKESYKSPTVSDDSPVQTETLSSSKNESLSSQTKFSLPVSNDTPQEVQPPSPRKLDLKRRSQFLAEASDKNKKIAQQLDTPKPISTVKKANAMELPLRNTHPETPKPERKISPGTKPKPSSLSNSPVPISEAFKTPQSTATIKKATALLAAEAAPKPKPTLIAMDATRNNPKVATAEDVDDSSVSSVKSAASLFSRSPFMKSTSDDARSSGVKSPIKLPTQADENAAMINAGLRSPKVDAQPTSLSQGLKPMTKQAPGSARPLPTPPIKSQAIPVAEVPRHLSARKTFQPPSQTETSKILTEFFISTDTPQPPVHDAGTIIANKPDYDLKVRSFDVQIFHFTSDGKKQLVPSHQERILFEGNMYLCFHTCSTAVGKKAHYVYFWAGDDVTESVVQDTEFFAQREARKSGGQLIKLRQGHEPTEFIEALGGIAIIQRGSSNRYDSLAPRMLCVRSFAGRIVFDEVDFAPSSLCSGFPYLISTQNGHCYLWKGKGSGVDELSCARLIGPEFGLTGEIVEVEDGKEPPAFLKVFGNDARINMSADHWRLKPNYRGYRARLFVSDSASKEKV